MICPHCYCAHPSHDDPAWVRCYYCNRPLDAESAHIPAWSCDCGHLNPDGTIRCQTCGVNVYD